jgi:hypothetical protein
MQILSAIYVLLPQTAAANNATTVCIPTGSILVWKNNGHDY